MSGIRKAILAWLASPPPPPPPLLAAQAAAASGNAATRIPVRRMGFPFEYASLRTVERDEGGGQGRVGRQPDLGERDVVQGREDVPIPADRQAEQRAERDPEE